MLLTKNGITVEVVHPADIARYKHLGYAEVKEEQPEEVVPTPKTNKPAAGSKKGKGQAKETDPAPQEGGEE